VGSGVLSIVMEAVGWRESVCVWGGGTCVVMSAVEGGPWGWLLEVELIKVAVGRCRI
jgi:hypothetical protein